MMPTLAQRFARLPTANPTASLPIAAGAMTDYAELAEHHYRAGRPATATRVLVVRRPGTGLGPRWRAMRSRPDDATEPAEASPPPVAVLVESLPSLSCRMRDRALDDRYGGWLGAASRARLLNDEVRCISRVVVHPQWRGQGLAVRLVRHALATATTPYTEALAAMGRVSPFFEKAGMTPYPRPPHRHDARLSAALERLGWSPSELAVTERLLERIAALPRGDRAWIEREFHRWRSHAGRRGHDPSATLRDHVLAARERLLLEPVYYLHANG